jgi:hypothetical protein
MCRQEDSMKRLLTASIVTSALSFAPSLAHAQEKGDVGITMGYPASIGIIWHATERVAIRPELSFSHTSNESESAIGSSEGSSTSFGLGVSAVLYLRKWDRLQTYVSPRYTYSRTRSETEASVLGDGSKSETDTHNIAGYFGAQYSPHERFSIFGEVGLGVAHSSGGIVGGFSEAHSTTTSTRTGVGVIFYF